MAEASRVYRAAIVGLGFMGAGDQVSGDALGQQVANLDGTHAQALEGHGRVQLVAGSSRDAGRRQRFAAARSVRTYEDWRELLDREPLDILSVATYTPQHAPIVIEAARRGVRAIYCEKPIASSPSEADAMLQACAAAGALLVINHNRRFNPVLRETALRVAAGELGELTSINLAWGTGRLGNVGTHLFDAAMMLSGRAVTAVSGSLDPAGKPDCRGSDFRDPGGWGVLRFEGGLHATVDAGDLARVPVLLTINGAAGRVSVHRLSVEWEWWDGRRQTLPMPRTRPTGMDHAVTAIVDHLDGKAPFPVSPAEAAWALETIVAFHLSHDRRAAWVDLPLQGDDRARIVRSG